MATGSAESKAVKRVSPRDSVFLIDISEDNDLSLPCWKETLDLCGLYFPAMTSASISFEASYDGVTYVPLWWDGALLTITISTASTIQTLDPIWFCGVRWLKIKTAGAEGADRTIYPIWRVF